MGPVIQAGTSKFILQDLSESLTMRSLDMSKVMVLCKDFEVTYTFAYYTWILHIHQRTDKWVYPFLEAVGYQKVLTVIFPMTAILAGSASILGFHINSVFQPLPSKKQKIG